MLGNRLTCVDVTLGSNWSLFHMRVHISVGIRPVSRPLETFPAFAAVYHPSCVLQGFIVVIHVCCVIRVHLSSVLLYGLTTLYYRKQRGKSHFLV